MTDYTPGAIGRPDWLPEVAVSSGLLAKMSGTYSDGGGNTFGPYYTGNVPSLGVWLSCQGNDGPYFVDVEWFQDVGMTQFISSVRYLGGSLCTFVDTISNSGPYVAVIVNAGASSTVVFRGLVYTQWTYGQHTTPYRSPLFQIANTTINPDTSYVADVEALVPGRCQISCFLSNSQGGITMQEYYNTSGGLNTVLYQALATQAPLFAYSYTGEFIAVGNQLQVTLYNGGTAAAAGYIRIVSLG